METLSTISPEQISPDVFTILDKDWTLITAGDDTGFNTMTATWGAMGILWNKKVCFIFVRPTRHTYGFTEKHDHFTLSFFTEDYRDALQICGTRSGRDGNKVAEADLTPVHGPDHTTWFREARLVIRCKKIYYNDILPENFLAPEIERSYPQKDYHRMYVGEIIEVLKK